MKNVDDDSIQKVFNEALKYDNSLLISSRVNYFRKCFFCKSKEVIHYTIMHETHPNSETAYQAKIQYCAMGNKYVVLAYLYGIINGANLNASLHEA